MTSLAFQTLDHQLTERLITTQAKTLESNSLYISQQLSGTAWINYGLLLTPCVNTLPNHRDAVYGSSLLRATTYGCSRTATVYGTDNRGVRLILAPGSFDIFPHSWKIQKFVYCPWVCYIWSNLGYCSLNLFSVYCILPQTSMYFRYGNLKIW